LLAHPFNTHARWRRGLIQLAVCAAAEPELNNLDDHKQPYSTLDPFNVVCRSIESAASAYDPNATDLAGEPI
jgi:hypothetical protein